MKTLLCSAFSVVAVALAAVPSSGQNPDGTAAEVRELVKTASPVLRKSGHQAVEIATPKWANGRDVEARAGLIESLAAGFAAEGITVRTGSAAKYVLSLEPETDKTTAQPAVRLRGLLRVGTQDREVGNRLLMGEEALARIYAPRSVVFDPKTPERDRVPIITGARKAPPAKEPKVGFEMLVRDPDGQFRSRAPVAGKVTVKELQTYYLRYFNNERDLDFGVLATIDGARWDEYAEEDEAVTPKGRMVLVKAGSDVIVKGWYASENKSLAFDLMAMPPFAAAKKPEIGVITTQWYPVWEKGSAPPAGEERTTNHRSVIGTAAVREQADKFVAVERHTGRMRVVLSIRYGR